MSRFPATLTIFAIASIALAGGAGYRYRWELSLIDVPSMHDMPIDQEGFEVQSLPHRFRACFARGRSVFFVNTDLNVCRLDDGCRPEEAIVLGPAPAKKSRWLHVTRRGTMLSSGHGEPVYRSDDEAKTWQLVNHCPCWRADEDDTEDVIYAGNYTPTAHPVYRACLFRSLDDGRTWEEIFRDPTNHHVHSVRLDRKSKRIILCVGDSDMRGEVYSDDFGRTWTWLNRGRGHGNTDVVVTPDFVVWGSDDHRGRIYRTNRGTLDKPVQILQAPRHQVWGMVAVGETVYAGTYCEHPECGHPAHLLASRDQGATWQNLLEIPNENRTAFGFMSTSRRATDAGWVYFSDDDNRGYRVRRRQPFAEE